VYRLTWRLPLAGLVAFSHLQFSQIRGRQPYLIVRKILYVIRALTVAQDWLGRNKSIVRSPAPDATMGLHVPRVLDR
jgi:hypothetical protein